MSKKLGILIPLILLIASLSAYTLISEDSDDPDEIKNKDRVKWTLMVYLDADNNLESAGIEDFNEMEEAGSTDDVNIVVLFDRAEGHDSSNGDWTDWRYYYVERDPNGANNEIISRELDYPRLEEGEEPNMGDPKTLIDFAVWSMVTFPAEHYLLSLWDHGGGIRGVCWDDSTPDHDNLDLIELRDAFAEVENTTGEKIDIIGFDACLMGGVSIHYQLNPYCDIIVASEATESNDGWPYELLCRDVVENPNIEPEDVAELLIEHYVASYGVIEPWVTMAAFRTIEMNQVFEDLDAVAEILMDNLPLYEASIADSRENAESYDMTKEGPYMPEMSGYPMSDLWDFLEELERIEHGTGLDEELMDAITVLKNSISQARIAYGSGTDMPDSHGLSIYFPQTENTGTSTYSERYDTLDFAGDHLWDDFLKEYYLD
ncbi:MAG: hypothetical protein KAU14_00540 [Thermoplasmata archaeon]|nr:hypothetical protein [Thermoplasmata archaeon]